MRVGAVLLRDQQILMAESSSECGSVVYSLGGAVMFNETSEEALLREVKEETDLDIRVLRLLFVHENFFYQKELGGYNHEVCLYYLVEPLCEENLDQMIKEQPQEHIRWIKIDDLEKEHAYPSFFYEKLSHLEDHIQQE